MRPGSRYITGHLIAPYYFFRLLQGSALPANGALGIARVQEIQGKSEKKGQVDQGTLK